MSSPAAEDGLRGFSQTDPSHRPAWRAAYPRVLPPAGTSRWITRRKAQTVSAAAGGLITADETCERYSLSLEEFIGW